MLTSPPRHPYEGLPPSAFWQSAVATKHPLDIADLALAKRKLRPEDRVASAGSCFAQHIARRLRRDGFNYLDVEPPPMWLRAKNHARFGFGLFSARYGNVYTSAQLVQLLERAQGRFDPLEKVWIDPARGRVFDPFRPTIEPDGFGSEDEALRCQEGHLHSVRTLFAKCDVFVFTLGLTETWRSKLDGSVYPMCPGTGAGTFDERKYEFVNLTYDDVMRDMRQFIRTLSRRRAPIHFLLTVSPVPLTATASGRHVLTATTHSKAVLRAAAGQLSQEFENVDYFPSYEMISSPALRGWFFAPNGRDIHPDGVSHVMSAFTQGFCEPRERGPVQAPVETDEELVWCDEKMLDRFA